MFDGPPDTIDLGGVRRALVVKLRHHGDVLLTSPLFSVLKSRAPHIEIDALVYADTADMLALHPGVNEIHGVDRAWRALPLWARGVREWRLFRKLRDRRYDLLIHLSEHPRGAWLARLLNCRYSVAPGYSGRSRYWRRSFTHRYALPKNALRHMAEWNLDALRRIGIQPDIQERKLVMVAGTPARERVTSLLRSSGLDVQRFIHIHPTSRWPFKCWPVERMARLLDILVGRGERLVLTAAPSDHERRWMAALLAAMKRQDGVLNLTGQLSLKELAALTARAALFVGVDSAPMHIAAAVGTPTVALFGPSGEAEWGPWQVPHRVVASKEHPCRPCGADGCGGGKISDCLVRLPEQRVLDAIDDLIRETSQQAAAMR